MIIAPLTFLSEEATMNIPIRETLNKEQALKRALKFEFEIGHFDQRGECRELDKIEVIYETEDCQPLDHES